MADIWTGTRRGLIGRGAALAGAAGLRRRGPAGGAGRCEEEAPAADRHDRGRLPGEPLVRPLLRLRALRRAPRRRRAGYTQPDGSGGTVAPFHFTSLSTTTSATVVGRPQRVERRRHGRVLHDRRHRLHGLLHRARTCRSTTACTSTSTLCVNYFCSVLGPTCPNRFYLAAGTSGGITTNGDLGLRRASTTRCILDLLDAAGRDVEGLQHRLGQRAVRRHGQRLRVLQALRARPPDARAARATTSTTSKQGPPAEGLVHDPELHARLGRAPAGRRLGRDGHPEADDRGAQRLAGSGTARPTSSPTTSTAGTSTTCRRRRLDAYGLGIRVPTWVISPYAQARATWSTTVYEHASILKFIERDVRPADARVREPHVRHSDAGRPNNEAAERRRARAAGAAARRRALDRRPHGVLQVAPISRR